MLNIYHHLERRVFKQLIHRTLSETTINKLFQLNSQAWPTETVDIIQTEHNVYNSSKEYLRSYILYCNEGKVTEENEECLDLARGLIKLWDVQVTVISNVLRVFNRVNNIYKQDRYWKLEQDKCYWKLIISRNS